MRGQTVLITGGASGIGRATAEQLADLGARVVVIARDAAKAQHAIEQMRGTTARDVQWIVADLASLASVRAAATEFRERFGVLDVLVNNAAVQLPSRDVTKDGYELHFGVNYLAHYLLTRLLLDLLVSRAPARIVNVGAMQAGAVIDFDDLNFERNWDRNQSITRAKMGLFLFTRELARRFGQRVVANVADPGLVKTPYHSDSPWFLKMIVRVVGADSDKAAATNVYLASSPEVAGVTGAFFSARKRKPWKGQALDDGAAARLWLESARLVGLNEDDYSRAQ